MRALTTTLLFLLTVLVSTAQSTLSTLHASRSATGAWDKSEEDWVWNEYIDVSIPITLKNNVILIANKAGTSLVTGKQLFTRNYTDRKEMAWPATEASGDRRELRIKLVYYKTDGSYNGIIQMYLFYNSFAVVFEIDPPER